MGENRVKIRYAVLQIKNHPSIFSIYSHDDYVTLLSALRYSTFVNDRANYGDSEDTKCKLSFEQKEKR